MFHAKPKDAGHHFIEVSNSLGPSPMFYVPNDQMGVFVYPSMTYQGKILWKLNIQLQMESLDHLEGGAFAGEFFGKAYGIEMVYVPKGEFVLGDPDPMAQYFGSFFKSNDRGEVGNLYAIDSEDEIKVATEKGGLFYKTHNSVYRGDQLGPIPTSFPKGYRAFYLMKYELKQGEYVDFLNAINSEQTQNRANFGGKGYYAGRGTIKKENSKYVAERPERPMNFCSWDDGMAYADWAGLRPFTEFEYTKAARGFGTPVSKQFPWGTASKSKLVRNIDAFGDLKFGNGISEKAISNENLETLGGSFFWIMDLSGSLWERVVSVGHVEGRSFEGSHGDGELDEYGFATNLDWPKGVAGKGGIGFRGGGFYLYGQNYSEINPHSPIAFRPYGAWHGWSRAMAYGQRFARTVELK